MRCASMGGDEVRVFKSVCVITVACVWALAAASDSQRAVTTTLPAPTTEQPTPTTTTTAAAASEVLLLPASEFVDYTETPTLLIDNLSPTEANSSIQEPSTSSSRPPSSTEAASGETTPAPENGSTEAPEAVEEEPEAPFEPPRNVSEYMDYVERLFRDFRHQISDLFEPHLPQLIRSSQMVQLSGACSMDMLRWALGLRQFEPWALRMIDSAGKIPEGIFEGSFTALGSYDECLNTVFSSPSQVAAAAAATQEQQQPPATKGKYCLVNVSPFLPPKPPADRVERLFQEEANRRNYSKDNQFSRLSPMFYYMKFRIGVCLPSTCLESDMDSIGAALSASLRLNISVPHCRVRQSEPLSRQQLVAGSLFGLVATLVVCATLVDLWSRKLDRIKRRERRLLEASQPPPAKAIANSVLIAGLEDNAGSETKQARFAARLAQHWSWLSFSALTNFRLYLGNKWLAASEPATSKPRQPISCLDGIRVISLCWVVLANSYVTLDPRATKLLSETRKAPKDFLFQLIAQASLAIETFFFLSGLLVSLSFAHKLARGPNRTNGGPLSWLQFYLHRWVRMTPATMLVIAFTMFAFRFGDGPLWLEATQKAHQSCRANWWRHLLHVANFVDTRATCFIHYWYIAADMQLFLAAPPLLGLLYAGSQRWRWLARLCLTTLAALSMGSLFYTTYQRNLPPTLLFYNSDPESRREYGNTIMTKPLTHAMPYMVGMLLGKWLAWATGQPHSAAVATAAAAVSSVSTNRRPSTSGGSLAALLGLAASAVALAELFLPYKWNNSHLPTRLLGALYAALFRFGWSLVLVYLVLACRHTPGRRCLRARHLLLGGDRKRTGQADTCGVALADPCGPTVSRKEAPTDQPATERHCMCPSGGGLLNRFLSLPVFGPLSRLSFVAYLIHLPLMSVFVSQTRSLFAFSHTLVLHLALSYLVMTFILSFVLVHLIEFPFITFERYLFAWLLNERHQHKPTPQPPPQAARSPQPSRRRLDIEDLRRKQAQRAR